MEDKIKQLIETYKKDLEFYKSIDEPKTSRVYKWVIEDLEKLLESENIDWFPNIYSSII